MIDILFFPERKTFMYGSNLLLYQALKTLLLSFRISNIFLKDWSDDSTVSLPVSPLFPGIIGIKSTGGSKKGTWCPRFCFHPHLKQWVIRKRPSERFASFEKGLWWNRQKVKISCDVEGSEVITRVPDHYLTIGRPSWLEKYVKENFKKQ